MTTKSHVFACRWHICHVPTVGPELEEGVGHESCVDQLVGLGIPRGSAHEIALGLLVHQLHRARHVRHHADDDLTQDATTSVLGLGAGQWIVAAAASMVGEVKSKASLEGSGASP